MRSCKFSALDRINVRNAWSSVDRVVQDGGKNDTFGCKVWPIAAALERDVRGSGEICEASCCQVFQGTPGSRKAEVTGVNGTDSNRAL